MRRLATVVFVLVFALPSFAQGGAEVDALREMFFANDLKTVLQHMPPEFEKAFAKAPIQTQRMLAERLMFRYQAEREGVKFVHPESGAVLRTELLYANRLLGMRRQKSILIRGCRTATKPCCASAGRGPTGRLSIAWRPSGCGM
jgi:hypothetical protein